QRHLAGDGGGRLDLPAESLAIDDRPARSDVDSRDRSQGIVELGQIDRQTDEVSDDRQLDPVEVDQAQFGVEPARQGDLPRLTERLVGAAQVDEAGVLRSEEHTSELQSRENLVCRLLLEKKKIKNTHNV